MKNLAKLLSLLLVVAMLVSALAACQPKNPADTNDETTSGEEPEESPYTKESREIYNAILGDFNAAYQAAKAEANVSKKWAMMAIAEAKLMESAVMLPTSTQGGNYALSRVAPYTVDYCLWGNDDEKWQTALIATEFIKAADRTEMKAKWNELKGTGTYLAWAKQFLADKGYTLQTTYSTSFNSFPMTWDVLATSRAADSQYIVKTYDGLMEYNNEGTQVPALAESVTVSADGLTYTFKIRETSWVDS